MNLTRNLFFAIATISMTSKWMVAEGQHQKVNATFIGSNEARVLVVSGSVAVVGAIVEVAGATGKLMEASRGKVGRAG